MPGKYEKLVKGERKAVRQSGARKEARKGVISEIYSAQKGGALLTSNRSDKGSGTTNQGAVSTSGRTASVKLKAKIGTQDEKAATFRKQAEINQTQFEKTRLGSRLASKAKKVATKDSKVVKRVVGTIKKK